MNTQCPLLLGYATGPEGCRVLKVLVSSGSSMKESNEDGMDAYGDSLEGSSQRSTASEFEHLDSSYLHRAVYNE